MTQTTYNTQAPLAFAGLLGDPNKDAYIRSMTNEDAAVAPFGLGYAEGTDPAVQFAAFSGAGVFAGILAHRHQTQVRAQFGPGGTLGTTGIQENEVGDIVTKGRVWVEVDEAVTAGGAVFVRHTTADIGKFRTDIDGGDAQEVLGAVFRSTTAGAGLALVELNTP